MHLAFTAEEQAFRAEVHALVESRLPASWKGWMPFLESDETYNFTQQFARELASRGWLTASWPKEYGGRETGIWEQTIFGEEMAAEREPRGPQYMSVNYIGPALMQFASDELKAEFLPKISRGEITFCQGFSEPDAGTDLAALKTRAQRDGDDYVINGEKIWTSYANRADYCYLLARTDPEAPKHRGISVFLVPMDTPGVLVRPIRSMGDTGEGMGDINNVFFDNVRIPARLRVGEENRGWYIATASLNHVRIGVARWARHRKVIDRLVEFARTPLPNGRVLANEAWVKQRIGELEIKLRATKLMVYRVIAAMDRGEDPSWEISLARLHSTQMDQRVANVGMEILGPYGRVVGDQGPTVNKGDFEAAWRGQFVSTIAGGNIDIQKNLVATKGLGLPRA